MSKKLENHCVGCGLPCMGRVCYYQNFSTYYCDNCEDGEAKYRIDGEDLCEKCTKLIIKEAFDNLTLSEQAEILGINLDYWLD